VSVTNHSDAFDLMLKVKARTEELSDEQRQRLDSHLSECDDCSVQQDALSDTIRDIRTSSFSITASSNLVRATQVRVRARAWDSGSRKTRCVRSRSHACWLLPGALVSIPSSGRDSSGLDTRTNFLRYLANRIRDHGADAHRRRGNYRLANGLQGKFHKRAL